MEKLFEAAITAVVAFAFFTCVVFLLSFTGSIVVWLVWNATVAGLLGLPSLSFWQVFGLIFCARAVFGAYSSVEKK